MKILVINCGSSSLKFQLIDSDTEKGLAKGLCERIGIEGSMITYAPEGGEKEKTQTPMPDHTEAIRLVLEALTNPKTGVVGSLEEIQAVGHRVVHGGEKFAESVVIDDKVLKAVEECNDLAPLHNPANLIGIDACRKLMRYSTLPSTRPCRRKPICTGSPMTITETIRSGVTAFTAPAIPMYQRRRPKRWGKGMRI